MQSLECPDRVQPHDATAERVPQEAHAQETARRLSDEVVSRFVLDPAAFARAADKEPAELVRAYRDSVDRRLAPMRAARPGTTASCPAGLARATFGGDAADVATPEGNTVRMGVIVLAIALALAAAAVATVASTLLVRHKPL